ncbi:hypothetical protein [Legionella tunisiensis]|uniref:hypothetical protein n=1 Tax=Legionella tunisiensis TaxID=1034944 RepID=UPI0003114CB8|nr:hypothetical protein [Legionella tunisiensis]
MEIRVYFLPKGFEPVINRTLDLKSQAQALLTQVADIIKHTLEVVQSSMESDHLALVIGPGDFWKSGCGLLTHRGLPQSLALDYFAREMVALSAQYPQIILIPGSIYLYVDKLATDKKSYCRSNSENFIPSVYMQNVTPVFYSGKCLRLIKRGVHLLCINDNSTAKELTSESEFLNALSSIQCQRLEVICCPDDASEEPPISDVAFLGKTPLPGENLLLETLDLWSDRLFSPVFTIKNVTFGVEIGTDHYFAAQHLVDQLENLDFHLLISSGQSRRYDGTNGCGFLFALIKTVPFCWICRERGNVLILILRLRLIYNIFVEKAVFLRVMAAELDKSNTLLPSYVCFNV